MNDTLYDLQVLVLDCQTTGSNADRHHLVEIGWLPVRAAEVHADRPAQPELFLVRQPGGLPLPGRIAKLTGISAAQMDAAADPHSIWRALCAAAHSVMQNNGMAYCPTVIHYARFETAFLKSLHQRIATHSALPLRPICTHAIAARILPGLPRKGLRAVAGRLGFSVPMVRRCAGHLQATAWVWAVAVRRLKKHWGICTLEALRQWLDTPAPAQRNARQYPLRRDSRLSLPNEPGIYRFARSNGDLLYIGKATRLRQRVNSYFQDSRRHSENTLEMLSQAARVDATVCRSALEAAVLESDEIKRCRPPYNLALTTGNRGLMYVARDMRDSAERRNERCRLGPVPATDHFTTLLHTGRWLAADGHRRMSSAAPSPLPLAPGKGPDGDTAALGLALFAQKYADLIDTGAVWPSLSRVARAAWQESKARLHDDPATEEDREADPGDRPAGHALDWTPESVARFIESNVRYCGFLLRRARWLAILSEATVAWSHRNRGKVLAIVLHQGRIAERASVTCLSAVPTPGHRHPLSRRHSNLDLPAYDRLRVMTTEIRRLLAEKRHLCIRLNRRAALRNRQLKRLLWWL